MGHLETLEENWEKILSEAKTVYVYGAAETARHFHQLIKDTGYLSKLAGFMVTSKKNSDDTLLNLPIVQADCFNDRSVTVLIPHTGVYKRQILDLLASLDYKNVILAEDFHHLYTSKNRVIINDDEMRLAQEIAEKYAAQKSESEKEKDSEICKQVVSLLNEGNPDFGHNNPYQTLERIGLAGNRPTIYRILKYKLNDYLKESDTVIDIGCNTGFIDMEISDKVTHIVGVEYDKCLSEAGVLVRDYLGIKNYDIINADFSEWVSGCEKKFNIVLSFAIHHWLNLPMKKYADILNNLLVSNGIAVIESHIADNDLEYNELLDILTGSKGFHVLYDGRIQDTGCGERNYVLLQKPV